MSCNDKTRTIGQRVRDSSGHTTGFDLIRILLAVAVLASHSIVTTYGTDEFIWRTQFRVFPALILPMFFALSGYLVAGSLFRSSSLTEFFSLRVLRIGPALFVEVCLSALLLGPLVTDLPLSRYFSDERFFSYWANIVGNIHYKLPGVFENNPVPSTVNGSLWTVPIELDCYIGLGVLAALSIVRRPFVLIAVFVAASVAFPVIEFVRHGWVWHKVPASLLVLCFLSGLTMHVLRDYIMLRPLLLIAAVAISLLSLTAPGICFFAPVPIAYVTVYIGLLNSPKIPLVMSGDYSYGVYLYAFPLQQAFSWVFASHRSWWLNIMFAVPASLAFAALSWHLVEKPLLKRKRSMTSVINRGIASCAPRIRALVYPNT